MYPGSGLRVVEAEAEEEEEDEEVGVLRRGPILVSVTGLV